MATPDAAAGAGERKENDPTQSSNPGGGGAAAATPGKPPVPTSPKGQGQQGGARPAPAHAMQQGQQGQLQRHQDPLNASRAKREWTAAPSFSGDRTLEPAFATRLRTAAVDDYR